MIDIKNKDFSGIEVVEKIVSALKNGTIFYNAIRYSFSINPVPAVADTLQTMTGLAATNINSTDIIMIKYGSLVNYGSATIGQIVNNAAALVYEVNANEGIIFISKNEWNNADFKFVQLWSNVFIDITVIDSTAFAN